MSIFTSKMAKRHLHMLYILWEDNSFESTVDFLSLSLFLACYLSVLIISYLRVTWMKILIRKRQRNEEVVFIIGILFRMLHFVDKCSFLQFQSQNILALSLGEKVFFSALPGRQSYSHLWWQPIKSEIQILLDYFLLEFFFLHFLR